MKKILTKNFPLKELIHSNTALHFGIDNTPTSEIVDNLELLCKNVLQPLREYVNKPIIVTSGYRSRDLNDEIGGAVNSDHLKGMAADIVFTDMDRAFKWLVKNLPFRQAILEQSGHRKWIHVSYDSNDLKQEALVMKNGRYTRYGNI